MIPVAYASLPKLCRSKCAGPNNCVANRLMIETATSLNEVTCKYVRDDVKLCRTRKKPLPVLGRRQSSVQFAENACTVVTDLGMTRIRILRFALCPIPSELGVLKTRSEEWKDGETILCQSPGYYRCVLPMPQKFMDDEGILGHCLICEIRHTVAFITAMSLNYFKWNAILMVHGELHISLWRSCARR